MCSALTNGLLFFLLFANRSHGSSQVEACAGKQTAQQYSEDAVLQHRWEKRSDEFPVQVLLVTILLAKPEKSHRWVCDCFLVVQIKYSTRDQ